MSIHMSVCATQSGLENSIFIFRSLSTWYFLGRTEPTLLCLVDKIQNNASALRQILFCLMSNVSRVAGFVTEEDKTPRHSSAEFGLLENFERFPRVPSRHIDKKITSNSKWNWIKHFSFQSIIKTNRALHERFFRLAAQICSSVSRLFRLSKIAYFKGQTEPKVLRLVLAP